eukprot:2824592-Pleurochrysis_carterae.AAC.2
MRFADPRDRRGLSESRRFGLHIAQTSMKIAISMSTVSKLRRNKHLTGQRALTIMTYGILCARIFLQRFLQQDLIRVHIESVHTASCRPQTWFVTETNVVACVT